MMHFYRDYCSLLLCVSMSLSFGIAFGQDPSFSQLQSNVMLINPAYAGSSGSSQLALSHREQWPNLSGNFTSYALGIDSYARTVSGGLGFIAIQDQAGISNTLSSTSFSGIYNYTKKLRNSVIHFAMQATYLQKSLDWSQCTYRDMIDPQRGFIYNTQDFTSGIAAKKFDVSTGFFWQFSHFNAGIAVHHLFEPNESLIGGTSVSRLPRKYTLHSQGRWTLRQAFSTDLDILPSFMYRRQGEFQQLDFEVLFETGSLLAGIGYRGVPTTTYRDAFIGSIGYKDKNWRLLYSYDLTLSDLDLSAGGAHEISLVIYQHLNNCTTCKKKFQPCEWFDERKPSWFQRMKSRHPKRRANRTALRRIHMKF